MKLKPILFSTEMVKAILEGRKTMTRREIKGLPEDASKVWNDGGEWIVENEDGHCWDGKLKSKYEIGQILWVRETWQKVNGNQFIYRANSLGDNLKWKPSIFMPKSACRLFLEVTNVRAERLQDISGDEPIREGLFTIEHEGTLEYLVGQVCAIKDSSEKSVAWIWQNINGEWKSNPFVWVITFKIVERPENFLQ
jgi:hypothetical protein